MLQKIIQFSITNKLVVVMGTLALVVWGVFSLLQLPIDAVPDITNNQVQIITTAPSSGAEDIERYVTYPIEQTMATIPDIEEVRSFSRFGLSVVTVVFKEETDIYWARDQVSQRLQETKNAIPQGMGDPTMAPVSTGLGEIYQYIVKPAPGYEKKYTASDLRTIQDWIIRRQLLGTPGVADVSGFGGYVKQYEVAVRPEALKSFGLSIQDLFNVLEKNNANTGGAYLTRSSTTYYIRTEGLTKNLDDIRNIFLREVNDRPVLIRDVAEVRFGSATRYGALTNADKGEAVGGIVLMLKDANASQVIGDVKERMEQIRKTLPEGVEVEVYLDRTKLVNKAISTVSTNLIEGALIVIFILVLLLGNFRAGLIVASVIPLAMLFAVAMMKVFGVSGNLMSLGAIDFGLIVDGAVIIVEATLHHLVLRKTKHVLSQKELDEEVQRSAGGIMKSAAFGEIIILMVYLPLLTLVGIEGKMFAPMAQTVIFAIIGAFILSLTYVPMISAMTLSKKPLKENTVSDRIVRRVQRMYIPALHAVIRRQRIAVLAVLGVFVLSLFLFSGLGAEFIPSLDEGDFAVELRAPAGTSLEQTRDMSVRAARVLKRDFPDEVKTCVGKIGTAEIPTDPMPMEACDLMIILNDKSYWKKAHNRDELAEKMQSTLEKEVLGATYGFQQPIQMRFNEMMAGAKQDVVVKIYGEDLDILANYGAQVGNILKTVKGAEDIYVEEVTGLPQLVVRYNRPAMARYGVSVEDLNRAINMGFAGAPSGQVFEGEKRFDLVVRLDKEGRSSANDLGNLTVINHEGTSIPISQVADVSEEMGPNQIQRDDAKRRIIVAFNVRGRDVESIVQELQQKVEKQVKFDTGYYPTYGGSYKNLEKARLRLSIAVPVALFLILFLLYLTFQSIRHAILIFSAIPLAAIGGIIALWVRGMPFSISAGVGFIALFGVAVLNGIVLVAEFNRLKKEETSNMLKVILMGTRVRLRPVMMTAMVASLGFLPMALSTGSGAEVQKPLATVVIGGLISATFLTLFLLPVVYRSLEQRVVRRSSLKAKNLLAVLLISGIGTLAYGQTTMTLEECVQRGKTANPTVKQLQLSIEQAQLDRKALAPIPKTNASVMVGQYNSANRNDNNITIGQTIPFPTVFGKATAVSDAGVEQKTVELALFQNQLTQAISNYYAELQFLKVKEKVLNDQVTLYVELEQSLEKRIDAKDASLLQLDWSKISGVQLKQQLTALQLDVLRIQVALQSLLNTTELIVPSEVELTKVVLRPLPDSSLRDSLPFFKSYAAQEHYLEAQHALMRAQRLPDISVGYFNQTLIGTQTVNGAEVAFTSSDRFQGVSAGLALPIFQRAEKAQLKQQELEIAKVVADKNAQSVLWGAQLEVIRKQWQDAMTAVDEWETISQPALEQVRTKNRLAYDQGEIGLETLLLQEQQALQLQLHHLELIQAANHLAIQYNTMTSY